MAEGEDIPPFSKRDSKPRIWCGELGAEPGDSILAGPRFPTGFSTGREGG
jgi:hypothetical protein